MDNTDNTDKTPSFAEEVRNSSFRDIVIEGSKPVEETRPEPIEVKAEQVDAKKDESEKIDLEALKKEAQEEARKTAEQTYQKKLDEQAQKQALDEQNKQLEEARKARKAPWHSDENHPKDEKGNPLPLTYDEIYEAAAQEGERRAIAQFEERQRLAQDEQNKQQAQKTQEDERQKSYQEEQNKALQQEIDNDLNDLYKAGKMPAIGDANDPNDAGVKAQRKLFETGMQINKDRLEKGLAPIRSIKLVFYEHYTPPDEQLPGADAPVSGNTPPVSQKTDEGYNWAIDHRKSMRQILAEEKRKHMKRVS